MSAIVTCARSLLRLIVSPLLIGLTPTRVVSALFDNIFISERFRSDENLIPTEADRTKEMGIPHRKQITMFINGQYHYIAIVPKEWEDKKQEKCEKIMADSCLEHRKKTTCIHGAATKISSVSTKLEYYDARLWFKRTDDKSSWPTSKSYFKMLLNLGD